MEVLALGGIGKEGRGEGRCAADGYGEDAWQRDVAGESGEGDFVVAEAVEEDEDGGCRLGRVWEMEFVGESRRDWGEICFGGYPWRHDGLLFVKKLNETRLVAEVPLCFMMMLS